MHKKWSNYKTRKFILLLAVLNVEVYSAVMVILVCLGIDLNDMLTDKLFTFWTFVAGSSGAITIAKVAKGHTNSDETEGAE